MTWIQAASSVCFKPYTLEESLKGIAQGGFVNVELGAVSFFHKQLDPDHLGPSEIEHARRLLNHYGLSCVSISGHAELWTDIGVTRLNRVLDACTDLGASVLNTFLGDPATPEEHQQFLAQIRLIADRAESLGIGLCLENDSKSMPTAKSGLVLLDEIGHDWVKLNYDPVNCIYFGGVAPEADIDFALGQLGHVQIKDKRGGEDVADFPPLGEGEFDLPHFLRRLRKIDYQGTVSMEIEFQNLEWPTWDSCLEASIRGRKYWDSVMRQLDQETAECP